MRGQRHSTVSPDRDCQRNDGLATPASNLRGNTGQAPHTPTIETDPYLAQLGKCLVQLEDVDVLAAKEAEFCSTGLPGDELP